MQPDLSTTNLILGIMAAVSVLQALVLIGAGIAGFMVYRRVMDVINGLEQRVDHAIRSTMDRVDDTADRLRTNVRAKTSRIVGLVRGARVALETILHSRAA
jgi:hypothetical protein